VVQISRLGRYLAYQDLKTKISQLSSGADEGGTPISSRPTSLLRMGRKKASASEEGMSLRCGVTKCIDNLKTTSVRSPTCVGLGNLPAQDYL
jgi:hypothetical protein